MAWYVDLFNCTRTLVDEDFLSSFEMYHAQQAPLDSFHISGLAISQAEAPSQRPIQGLLSWTRSVLEGTYLELRVRLVAHQPICMRSN